MKNLFNSNLISISTDFFSSGCHEHSKIFVGDFSDCWFRSLVYIFSIYTSTHPSLIKVLSWGILLLHSRQNSFCLFAFYLKTVQGTSFSQTAIKGQEWVWCLCWSEQASAYHIPKINPNWLMGRVSYATDESQIQRAHGEKRLCGRKWDANEVK